MRKPLNSALLALILLHCLAGCSPPPEPTVIAFGSCSHENDSLQMWDQIIKHQPEAWIWLGDNIYGDTYDMALMQSKYEMQKTRPSYQKLLQSTPVYGIWDDHDFGINDGGKGYRMKNESKRLMLDFLDVSPNNPVWQRDGAYQSYIIKSGGLQIKLILLDTRFFRDSLEINVDRPPLYHPNENGTILGESQWKWLEEELHQSSADVHLIASSIQLIPNDHGFEKWGNFPVERQRFFDLIKKTDPAVPIVLSGDRHIAEFSKIELEGLEYPLVEFTSSGLTHTWSQDWGEENRHRIGNMVISKNFGIIQLLAQANEVSFHFLVYGPGNEVLQEMNQSYHRRSAR
jgi:alkaline phosphatase D